MRTGLMFKFTVLMLLTFSTDARSSQSEEPVKYAVRPPQQRTWKGSLVAPFAANTQLVLYKCPKDSQKVEDNADPDTESKYLVQVLHNEKPVTLPVCVLNLTSSAPCFTSVRKLDVLCSKVWISSETLTRVTSHETFTLQVGCFRRYDHF